MSDITESQIRAIVREEMAGGLSRPRADLNDVIPISDLAVVTPGQYDHVVVEQMGAARKALAPEVNAAAAHLQGVVSQLDATARVELAQLIARSQADIAPVIAGIGYLPPINYSAGIEVATTRMTVAYNGAVYAPAANTLPFVTADQFDDTKWRVIQGVVGTDLAAEYGASMVGVQLPGQLAVPLTLADLANLDTIDILTHIPKTQWAAISGRVSVFDCRPAFEACVATGKRVSFSMPGRYRFATPYAGTSDMDAAAVAGGVELDFSSVSGVAFSNSGSILRMPNLAQSPVKGRSVVVFSSLPDLQVGDWFCLYDPRESSYSGWRSYYKAGEWKQVIGVNGNSVSTTEPLCASYDMNEIEVHKLRSVRSRLHGFKLLGGSSSSTLIRFSMCESPRIEAVEFEHKGDSTISFDRCVAPIARDIRGRNDAPAESTQYGIVISNSQHARIYNCEIYGTRHAIACGGGNGVLCVPVRDFRCYSSILRNHPEISVGAADMHGNIEDSSYEQCSIYGAANVSGGGNCWYLDCDIVAPGEVVGWVGYFREMKGGQAGFKRCRFWTSRNPQPFVRGIIDCGGNSDSAVNGNTTEPLTLVVEDCEVNGRNLSNSTSFFLFRNRGSSSDINFSIKNIRFDVDALGPILATALVSGVASSKAIAVEGISGAPAGTALHSAQGGAYLGFPHRLQRQSGVWQGESVAGTAVVSPVINYPLAYPRSPRVSFGLSARNGAALFLGAVGGQLANVSAYQATGVAVRPQVRTSAAMSAGDTFDVSWSAEIAEF